MKTVTHRIISLALALNLSVIHEAKAASWVTTIPMTTAREYHTATLLSNGKVLVAGGFNGGYLSSAELYDPATGTWTATGTLTTERGYHTATLLSNGKVLVAGGYGSSGYLSSAELYDTPMDLSPFRIASIAQQGNDMLITWQTFGGTTNVVQVTPVAADGSYDNNFTDLSPQIIITGTGLVTTNYPDTNGATNNCRYYRVRLVQ